MIKSIVEEGDSTTGNVSEVKYVHEYLERSPQSTAIGKKTFTMVHLIIHL